MSHDACRGASSTSRTRNDAFVRTRGLDLLVRYVQDTSRGRLSFGFNGTYIIDFAGSQIQADWPLADRVSTPNYPVNLKIRGSAGWQRGAFNFTAFLNFLNDYQDRREQARTARQFVDHVRYESGYAFGAVAGAGTGRTTLTLGADNLFNRDPPFLNNPVGVGLRPGERRSHRPRSQPDDPAEVVSADQRRNHTSVHRCCRRTSLYSYPADETSGLM